MKRTLVILSLVLLMLAACARTETTSIQTTGIKQAQPSTVTNNAATPEDDIQAQVKADTESKNDITESFFLPINNKEVAVGDYVVFGSMFNLVNRQPGTYFAKITFIEGRDKSSNKIESDKNTMMTWIRSAETTKFLLEKGGQFVPLEFRPKDETKPGVKTVPGSYRFDVTFFQVIDTEFDQELSETTKSVYVRVK